MTAGASYRPTCSPAETSGDSRSEEQDRLARFTGFGASKLANSLFRRAGQAFRPGWEKMGLELDR